MKQAKNIKIFLKKKKKIDEKRPGKVSKLN